MKDASKLKDVYVAGITDALGAEVMAQAGAASNANLAGKLGMNIGDQANAYAEHGPKVLSDPGNMDYSNFLLNQTESPDKGIPHARYKDFSHQEQDKNNRQQRIQQAIRHNQQTIRHNQIMQGINRPRRLVPNQLGGYTVY